LLNPPCVTKNNRSRLKTKPPKKRRNVKPIEPQFTSPKTAYLAKQSKPASQKNKQTLEKWTKTVTKH